MKKRIFWLVLILMIGGSAVGYLLLSDKNTAKNEPTETPLQTLSEIESLEKSAGEETELSKISEPATVKDAKIDKNVEIEGNKGTQEYVEVDEELRTMFQVVDKREDLLLDENTRLNIEKLTALNTPEELDEKFQKLSTVLPATAYHQLVELTETYNGYISSVKVNFPPEVEVNTVGEALEDLQRLHDLRVKYFGTDTAETFFGKEERISQRLLELMSQEADANMTMEEKAHKAQILLQNDPEFQELYNPDRD